MTKTTEKPPVPKAAAWMASGELVVVAARGKEASCFVVRDGKTVKKVAAVDRASRVAVLASGAVLTVARDGKTCVVNGKAVTKAKTGFEVIEMAGCRGVAYAGGDGALARFDEAEGAWVDAGLPGCEGEVASIIEGPEGPIVGVNDGETRIVEWTGGAWVERGVVNGDANAIARAPDGTMYGLGSHVWTKGRRFELGNDAWGGAFVGGSLYVTTLGSIVRVAEDGRGSLVLAPDGEEPHNHSLFSTGTRAAYVCGPRVYVIDGHGDPVVWFGPKVDPKRHEKHAASVAAKAKVVKGRVELDNKKLHAFPVAVTRLSGVKALSLSVNEIGELPPELGRLTELEELDLSYNNLIALPDEIGALKRLRTLNLHLNCVARLPASFAELAALEELGLGMNTSLHTLDVIGAVPMTAVPPQLRALKKLRSLTLTMNELSEVPAWFAELTALEKLDLSSNRFTVFPDAILGLPLRSLSIGYQPWTSGVTPLVREDADARPPPEGLAKVCAMTTLRELYIDRLDLNELPADIGALTELETLSIAFTKISTLPPSFFELTKLRTLHVDYAPLTAATKAALKKRLPACKLAT